MSAGLSFGSLPAFADLSPDQQAQVMAALQQGQPAPAPVAQSPMSGLLGHVDPQADPQGPQPVAMSEADAQRMERAMASPQDRAALGSLPGSPDALLYDRTGMGSGPNAFTGSADPYGSRMVPGPPQRPSDADLLAAPTATGSVSGLNPIVPQGQTVASSKTVPGPLPNQYLPATPADRAAEPTSGRPLAGDFDPLTGQPVSGSPRAFGASPSAVSPSGAATATAASLGQGQQPGIFERFANGLNNPDVSNLLMHLSMGLISQRGFGPGLSAGMQSYQASQSGSLKNQLEQIKFLQDQQGRQDTYSHLVNNLKLDPVSARAAMNNPTLLSSIMAQQNKAPNTVDYNGVRYLVPPGAANDQSQWQRIGAVNGPQPGFEADPNNPGGQRPIAGSVADPSYKATVAGAEAKAKSDAVPDKPIQVRPGAVVLDPSTMKPLYEAPGNKPQGFETEDKLRTEFSKQLGTFSQVHDGYGRVIAATRQREANPGTVSPASDIGLIFGYMKMLDPGSVVREGEYATAKNAAGVPERVLNAYNKALNGEFLSNDQRKDFLGQAAELYGTARKTADGVADRYRGLATQYGVSPDRSVYLPEVPTPPKIGQPAQTMPDIPQGAPTGTRRAPDGNLYAPDPARPGKYLQVR